MNSATEVCKNFTNYETPTFAKKSNKNSVSPVLYHTAAKTAIFITAGFVALVFVPFLAAPLFTIGITVGVTRLAVKIAEVYHVKAIEKIQYFLADIRDKHKYIQIAFVIGILVVAYFSPIIACIAAIPFGIYSAIVVGLDYFLAVQNANRKQCNNGDQQTLDTVYIR